MAGKPRDILGSSDAALASASEIVRRWDIAFVSGVFALVVVSALSIAAFWAVGQPELTRIQSLRFGAYAVNELAVMGKHGWVAWPWFYRHPGIALRLGAVLLLAGASSSWVFWQSVKPTNRVRHIEGDRLLEGREAERGARTRSPAKPWAFLHPLLGMAKKQFTMHGLISGGPGSGKTQIFWTLIEQIAIRKNRKSIIYDIKGDFTAAMPDAMLISPWDARSAFWDISADIRTPQAAETLAQSLIPSKDGEFWGPASRAVVVGVLISLIYEREHNGKPWGWRSLADRLMASDPYELHDLMSTYYPPGLRMLADPSSTTALNVLQTVAAHTRIIDQLAVAWGNGEGRRGFSVRRWAQDGYKGPRQVILQAGPDRELTSRYIAAMINTLVPHVTSPALEDREEARTLAFFIDEFASLGRIDDIANFIDKGRSKGCTVWLAYQSIEQIKERYSPHFASNLMSMVATHIVCRLSMGETQTAMAGLFGKRRVAVTSHSHAPGTVGPSISQHEETRPVVLPTQIGALGPVSKKNGFVIRAIVKIAGFGDPLLLEFPGKPLPKLRPAFVPAQWTLGVPKNTKRIKAEAENESAGGQGIGGVEIRHEQRHDQFIENKIDPLDGLLDTRSKR